MALAIDGSSPAVATGAPTATTASFTPPAGSVLLIAAAMDSTSSNPAAPSITDNLGAHLTYTLVAWQSHADAPAVIGQAVMWWAVVGTSAAMTVSVTNGVGGFNTAAKVWVITGADLGTPVGARGKAGATGGTSSIAQNYTAQATSGQGFIVVNDDDALGVMTAGTGCTMDATGAGGGGDYGFARRTTADDTAGTGNTLNVTVGGASFDLAWVYAEVQPAGAAAGSVSVPGTFFPPPPLLWELAARNQAMWLGGDPGTGAQVTADTGLATFGLAASADAVQVAVRTGAATLGLATTGTAAKVAVVTGRAAVGLAGTSTTRKVSADAASSALGQASSVASRKAAPATCTAPVGLAATGATRKVAPSVERATLGLAGVVTSRRLAVVTGAGQLGLLAGFSTVNIRAVLAWAFLSLRAQQHQCITYRSHIGTTARPSTGTTTYALATTARPSTGVTARPDTGTTTDPC